MLDKAIEKIKAEIDSSKNNPYIHVVGDFLLQYLKENHEAAEKMLQEDKTIGKSLDEMKKAAEKKKIGNCAVLTDQEGFGIVLKYFGIEDNTPVVSSDQAENVQAPIVQKNRDIEFNVELDF